MSRRASRWLLWLVFGLTVPLPIQIVGAGMVPAAHLLMLGGISATVLVFVHSGGAVGLLTAILLGQAAFYLAILWLAAAGVAWALGRLPPRGLAIGTLGLAASLLLAASVLEPYHTPFAAESARSNLLGVLR